MAKVFKIEVLPKEALEAKINQMITDGKLAAEDLVNGPIFIGNDIYAQAMWISE